MKPPIWWLFLKLRQTWFKKISKILEEKTMDKKFKYNQRLRVDFKDLKKFMEYKGYHVYRQKNSTHTIFKNDEGKTIPIPYKHGTICQGTVSKILKQMGEDRSELAR